MQMRRAYPFGGEVDWEALADRMGADHLGRRIMMQNLHYENPAVRARRFFSRQLVKIAATFAFRISGLYALGQRNFRDIQVVERDVSLPRLPDALDGFRLLQISDLHLDLDSHLADIVVNRLQGVEYDLAVMTGDFRNSTYGDFHPAVEQTGKVIRALADRPLYGILGNHDYVEMALLFEQMGMQMLLNESVEVRHSGETFSLAGIDDPHLYQTGDIGRAAASIPQGVFSILLSHAPEAHEEAERAGFDFFLCGHTHGGQICAPGGKPILTHCHAPRSLARGAWRSGKMEGYTTTGTGGCGAPLRLNCPPEIVIHILRAAAS